MLATIEQIIEEIDNEFYKENHYYLSRTMPEEFAKRVAIKTASLHVTEALKEAAENAKTTISYCNYGAILTEWNALKVDKDSILNAYPLKNIK